MNQKFRLKRSADFKKVKDSGQTYYHPYLKLAVASNGLAISRFGVVVSKIIGNAVVRNRCKRRVRAVLNQNKQNYENGWDFVFIIRKRFLHSTACDLQAAVEHLVQEAGLLKTKNNKNL